MSDEEGIKKKSNVIHFDCQEPYDHNVLQDLFANFIKQLEAHDFEGADIEDALFWAFTEFTRKNNNIPPEAVQPEVPSYVVNRELLKAISGHFVERFDAPIVGNNITLPYGGDEWSNIATASAAAYLDKDETIYANVAEFIVAHDGNNLAASMEAFCRNIWGNQTPDGHSLDDVNFEEIAHSVRDK